MRYFLYLIASFIMQLVAWIITPILPLFARSEYGPIDNSNDFASEPRLPKWLSWFMTPDNSLYGDKNWKANNYYTKHWSMVAWLYRNSLYGFKWTVLAAPMSANEREMSGPSPTWTSLGFQRIKMNSYWQWHLVKRLGPVTINWNFGWLLNDGSKQKALFMFSPRVRIAK